MATTTTSGDDVSDIDEGRRRDERGIFGCDERDW